MGTRRDGLAGLSFVQALPPQDLIGGSAYDGVTVDLRGYDQCVFVVNIGAATAAGVAWTAQYWNVIMEHGLASAAGVSAWSIVTAVNVLHSIVGSGGAYSTVTSGIVISFASADLGSVRVVGYLGDTTHRYVRLRFSETGTPSTTSVGAVAVLGRASQWPVVEAVGH